MPKFLPSPFIFHLNTAETLKTASRAQWKLQNAKNPLRNLHSTKNRDRLPRILQLVGTSDVNFRCARRFIVRQRKSRRGCRADYPRILQLSDPSRFDAGSFFGARLNFAEFVWRQLGKPRMT